MNKVTLYSLSEEYIQLFEALMLSADENGEIDSDISLALDNISGKFEEKAIAVATVWRAIDSYENDIATEIKRLQAIKKRVERESDKLKSYLSDACQKTGLMRLQGVHANILFKKSKATIVDDIEKIPKEYIEEKITYTPNLNKIKSAIESGTIINGAHIEERNNIQIK